jgi:glycosyltransferase 2 family protein
MSQFLKNAKRWLPGTLISIILIVAILYFVDWSKVLTALRSANYSLLAVAVVFSFAWMAVRAIVWRTLLRDRPPYSSVFTSLNEGYLLNNFLPFRLGEIGRAFLLSRKTDMQFAEILPTIIIERATDLGFTAAIFLASLPFIVGAAGADRIGYIIGALVVIGLLALYLLARYDRWALDAFHKASSRFPVIQRLGGSLLESFLTGLAVLTDGWLFARFLFWMAVNWGMALLNYYLIISAFFPQARLTWAMFGLGAAAFGGAVPSLPGAVGTFEGAFGGALSLLSGDRSTSLAVALTSHFMSYLVTIVLGGYALSLEGQTLSGIYRQLVKFRSKGETDDSPL